MTQVDGIHIVGKRIIHYICIKDIGRSVETVTPYSSIIPVINSVSITAEVDIWDPSESEEEVIMLSRSSNTMIDGALSKASDT